MEDISLFTDKKYCCGCELCAHVCPTKIISLFPDNEGFFYPEITDSSKCLKCHKCEKVCPVKNVKIGPRKIQEIYAGYAKDENSIKKSASGGLAMSISQKFIENTGIIYGVRYSSDFTNIEYTRLSEEKELDVLRTSKYCQARKYNIYENVIEDLKRGGKVLFIGLPCDIAALNNLSKNKYSNLFTVELICHGTTSHKVHQEYIYSLKQKTGASVITSFSVRYKLNGWKPYYVQAKFNNNKNFTELFHESEYGIAFRYLKRPSCNICRFKLNDYKFGLQADLTIGDYHYAHRGMDSYNEWGSSVAFVHTNKGNQLLETCQDIFHLFKTDSRSALKNRALYEAIPAKINRSSFAKCFVKKGLTASSHLLSVKLIDRVTYKKKELKEKLSVIKRVVLGRSKIILRFK